MQREGARDRRRTSAARRRRFRRRASTRASHSSSWLADNHFTFLGYRCHDLVTIDGAGRAADRAGHEPRHRAPARGAGQGRRGELRRAAARGARVRATARAAGHHQVDVALDRASARLSRLHRGQALRRRGRGVRRASLPRPLHVIPPTAPIRPTFRCCGARSPTWFARADLPRRRPRRARR